MNFCRNTLLSAREYSWNSSDMNRIRCPTHACTVIRSLDGITARIVLDHTFGVIHVA